MCTLVLAHGVWKDVPLLVATNRDEQLGRPSEPPAMRQEGETRILAPKDLKAGGTWLGVNEHGLFVGITNRWTPEPAEPERSRGLLVMDTLQAPDASSAADSVEAVNPDHYAPFHLLIADRERAFLLWSDGTRIRRETLAPGFHVLTERSLGAAPSPRIDLLHRKVTDLFGPTAPVPTQCMELLRTKAEPSIEGICVHDVDRQYGTRSSTILMLAADAKRSLMLHADGPPDRTDYTDRTADLKALLVPGG